MVVFAIESKVEYIKKNGTSLKFQQRGIYSSRDHYLIFCKIGTLMTKNDNVKAKSSFYRNKPKFDTKLFDQDLNFSLQRLFHGLPPLTDVKFNSIFRNFVKIVSQTID